VFTNYTEALQYLYANLPIFQRIGAIAYKADLSNTIRLCEVLGNPQNKFKAIHIAGTNGKGSSSHMLASILQTAGYNTGLYTSPHLKEFTERIRVNGVEIDQAFVVDFVNRIRPAIEEIRPSFFEITVVMAFDFFAQQNIDIAIVEVGLGGRLDATNVITPILSLVTNIGWDHTDILGDTLQKIAVEKAGIIKRHIPVVISERQVEVEGVFVSKALQENAPIYFATDDYTVISKEGQLITFDVLKNYELLFKDVALPLQGYYQEKNLAGVLKAIALLQESGYKITNESILDGLKNVILNTNLKGRWQKLNEKPLIICDTGHNVDGMKEIVRQIRSQRYHQLHFVLGTVKDKDITKVLSLLPAEAKYYFCQAKIPRALDARDLALKAKEFGLNGIVIQDVNEAILAAKEAAQHDDFIFIGGSTFVVAEIENL
jgi:dihydrofolate synthase/folylpolyglutamate synthase